jgi:hypothetical protein
MCWYLQWLLQYIRMFNTPSWPMGKAFDEDSCSDDECHTEVVLLMLFFWLMKIQRRLDGTSARQLKPNNIVGYYVHAEE